MYSRQARVVEHEGQRSLQTEARGYEVLRDPALNKGSAFSQEEREALGLSGLLPPEVTAELEPQLRRIYEQYCALSTDLDKHVFMWRVHDNSAVLFYAVLQRHLLEMLPVVYDPTVGEAIMKFSQVFTRPRGVFLSIDAPEDIEDRLSAFGAGPDDIDLIVATDAEEILGIGDWGAGGIDISVGKLAVYTAAAGVDPHRVIPVVLDVGTDNVKLLDDPLYVGLRRGRVRGEAYDEFVDAYVRAAQKLFPNALLHWEDFGSTNARRILDRHRDHVPTFNDDMQGTGAITMSGLFNAVKLAGTSWREQRVIVLGAGTAGCGIADQIRDALMRAGLTAQEAERRLWLVDIPGLLTSDMDEQLLDYQQAYARPAQEVADWARTTCSATVPGADRWPAMSSLRKAIAEKEGIIDLTTVVNRVKPTILVGTSTTPGAFTEEVVTSMASNVERPIIFPLSNPTPLAEATPEQILSWTGGKALVATGSPFDDVTVGGVTFHIGQANNAALYPGLGLGAIVSRATKVTDGMILAAAQAVADQADLSQPGASLLPSNADLRTTSSIVAVQVFRAAQDEGVTRAQADDVVEAVRAASWWPVYTPVVAT